MGEDAGMEDLRMALARRFGAEAEAVGEASAEQVPPLWRAMAARGSGRAFDGPAPTRGEIRLIAALALCAPTKSDLQQRDIVLVSEPAQRDALAALVADQAWTADAPAFVVICANHRRQRLIHQMRGRDFVNDHLDAFFNASVDAGIHAGVEERVQMIVDEIAPAHLVDQPLAAVVRADDNEGRRIGCPRLVGHERGKRITLRWLTHQHDIALLQIALSRRAQGERCDQADFPPRRRGPVKRAPRAARGHRPPQRRHLLRRSLPHRFGLSTEPPCQRHPEILHTSVFTHSPLPVRNHRCAATDPAISC